MPLAPFYSFSCSCIAQMPSSFVPFAASPSPNASLSPSPSPSPIGVRFGLEWHEVSFSVFLCTRILTGPRDPGRFLRVDSERKCDFRFTPFQHLSKIHPGQVHNFMGNSYECCINVGKSFKRTNPSILFKKLNVAWWSLSSETLCLFALLASSRIAFL